MTLMAACYNIKRLAVLLSTGVDPFYKRGRAVVGTPIKGVDRRGSMGCNAVTEPQDRPVQVQYCSGSGRICVCKPTCSGSGWKVRVLRGPLEGTL